MSASLAEPDLIEVTDLESLFEEDLPCGADPCSKPAAWIVTGVPCGHSIHLCTFHKLLEVRGFEMHRPNAFCHANRDVVLTGLKVEEL